MILPNRRSALLLASALSFTALTSLSAVAAPKVVTTIAPVHSITAAIMQNVGTPEMLVPQSSSPHSTDFRPSQARMVQEADLVVWVGRRIETFLVDPLKTIAKDAHSLELSQIDGLTILPVRTGANWEKHKHGPGEDHHDDHGDHKDHDKHDDHKDHDHEKHDEHAKHDDHKDEKQATKSDNHIWLDPQNGIAMAKAIAHELIELDPANKETYEANEKALVAQLEKQIKDLSASLKSAQNKPFIVFHDAYQYFENRFGLTATGSVMLQPGVNPGAARVKEIRQKLVDSKAKCLFSEPQFSDKIIPVLVENTPAKLGSLDPIGKTLEAGPTLYTDLLAYNANAIKTCLSD